MSAANKMINMLQEANNKLHRRAQRAEGALMKRDHEAWWRGFCYGRQAPSEWPIPVQGAKCCRP